MKKKKKKLTYTLLSLLLATIFGFSSFSFFATNTSKELYFASEIAFTRISSKEYNADWVSDPFIVDPEQVEDYRKVYNDDTLVPGNVYQVRVVDGKEQAVCLASGEYTSRSVAGSDLYLASGKNVYLMDLFTLKKELIYEGSESVSSVQATSDLAFFKAGDSVYRYYKPSDTVDFILTIGDVFDWFPVSNQAICVMTENPDFIEAVAVSGVDEFEKLKDPEAFAHWLKRRFNIDADSSSQIFTQCSVEEVLNSSGIKRYKTFWYNPIYKHTFVSNGDGTYYWDSTELVEEGKQIPLSAIYSPPATEAVGGDGTASTATDNGETTAPVTDIPTTTDNGETTAPATDNGETTAPATETPTPSDSSVPTDGAAEEASFPWVWVCIGGGAVIVALGAILLLKKKK